MWVRLPPRAPIFLIEDERVVGAPSCVYLWSCSTRTAEPESETPLFSRNRLNAGALAVQLFLCAFLVCYNLYQAFDFEKQQLAGRPPFYGIWVVDEFTYAGNVVPPLLRDKTRWQRVIFHYPKGVCIQSIERFMERLLAAARHGEKDLHDGKARQSSHGLCSWFYVFERRSAVAYAGGKG